jgi:hypothetical protein
MLTQTEIHDITERIGAEFEKASLVTMLTTQVAQKKS